MKNLSPKAQVYLSCTEYKRVRGAAIIYGYSSALCVVVAAFICFSSLPVKAPCFILPVLFGIFSVLKHWESTQIKASIEAAQQSDIFKSDQSLSSALVSSQIDTIKN